MHFLGGLQVRCYYLRRLQMHSARALVLFIASYLADRMDSDFDNHGREIYQIDKSAETDRLRRC